jgi:putative oxidoreductase
MRWAVSLRGLANLNSKMGSLTMNALVASYARLTALLEGTWYAIPLRLIVGYGFMEHGYAKLARGPESFVNILHAIGVPEPSLLAGMTILVELIGGFAVLVGAFIPLASIPMAAVLLVAIFTVHLPYGFSSIKLEAVTAAGAHFGQPGYETDLLYLAALCALVLGGSGPLAIDRFLIRNSARTFGEPSGRPLEYEGVCPIDQSCQTSDDGRRPIRSASFP